jgi:hypothetical protein
MEYNDEIIWFPPDAPYSPKMEEVLQCTIDTITFRGSFTIVPQCLPFYITIIKNEKWYSIRITEIIEDESKPEIIKLRYCINYEIPSAKNPKLAYDDAASCIEFIKRMGKRAYKASQIVRRERGEDVEVPADSDDDDQDDPYCGFIPPGVSYDETDGKYYYDDSDSEESFHCGCCYDPYPDDPYGGHTPPGFDCEEEVNLRKAEGQDHHTKKQKYKRCKSSLQSKDERAQIVEHKHRVLRNEIADEKKNADS